MKEIMNEFLGTVSGQKLVAILPPLVAQLDRLNANLEKRASETKPAADKLTGEEKLLVLIMKVNELENHIIMMGEAIAKQNEVVEQIRKEQSHEGTESLDAAH